MSHFRKFWLFENVYSCSILQHLPKYIEKNLEKSAFVDFEVEFHLQGWWVLWVAFQELFSERIACNTFHCRKTKILFLLKHELYFNSRLSKESKISNSFNNDHSVEYKWFGHNFNPYFNFRSLAHGLWLCMNGYFCIQRHMSQCIFLHGTKDATDNRHYMYIVPLVYIR